jgi:hypothetical protein
MDFICSASIVPVFTSCPSPTNNLLILPDDRATFRAAGYRPVSVISAAITSGYLKKQLPTASAAAESGEEFYPLPPALPHSAVLFPCKSSPPSASKFLTPNLEFTVPADF